MAAYTQSFTIPANSTENDLLSGTRIESVPAKQAVYMLLLYATASATGAVHELFVDSENVIERSLVSAANRVPEVDKDGVLSQMVYGGSRLQLNVTNTTAAPITYFVKIDTEAQ